jgi:hypothetical protein
MLDALCAQTDPDAFFPEYGGSIKDATDICAKCDVRERCLQYAMENNFDYDGIFGGLSPKNRRKLRAKREGSSRSKREQVISMTARHMTTEQISEALGISFRQVQRYRQQKAS